MCVIIYVKINGKQFLVKHRDRAYNPKINIIHEIIDGMEVVYMHDLISGWKEGINDLGVALVNSALSHDDPHDKEDIIHHTDHNTKQNIKQNIKQNNPIYNVLVDKKFEQKLYNCLNHDNCSKITKGHNLIVTKNNIFHLEKYTNKFNNEFFLNKLNDDQTIVLTNHSIYNNGGYKIGRTAVSSFLRKEIVEHEILHNNIHTIDDLLNIMNTNYVNIDPRFHPYRDGIISKQFCKYNNSKFISTTSQIVFNITDKIFNYYSDIHHIQDIKYINKLPNNYQPKIQVNIYNTEKNMNRKKTIFTQSYLNKIYKIFNYKHKNSKTQKTIQPTKKHKTRRNNTKRNKTKKHNTRRNNTKRNKTKRNKTKRNKTI